MKPLTGGMCQPGKPQRAAGSACLERGLSRVACASPEGQFPVDKLDWQLLGFLSRIAGGENLEAEGARCTHGSSALALRILTQCCSLSSLVPCLLPGTLRPNMQDPQICKRRNTQFQCSQRRI